MNKINKLVGNTFSDEVYQAWMSDDVQKKVKKIVKPKTKAEKSSDSRKQHTPYIRFCMEERPQLKKKYPDMSAKEITAKLGEQWNNYKIDNPRYLEDNYGYIAK